MNLRCFAISSLVIYVDDIGDFQEMAMIAVLNEFDPDRVQSVLGDWITNFLGPADGLSGAG